MSAFSPSPPNPLPSPACSTHILLPGEPLGSSDTPLPTSPLVPAGGMDSPCLRPSGSPGAREQRRVRCGARRCQTPATRATQPRVTYRTLTYLSVKGADSKLNRVGGTSHARTAWSCACRPSRAHSPLSLRGCGGLVLCLFHVFV